MIALFAGRGRLPTLLIEALEANGQPKLVCVLEGQPAELPPSADVLTYRIETLGSLLRALTDHGVTELCLCGALTRPVLDPDAVDAATQPLIGRLGAAMRQGDDGTLRALMGLLEEAGFRIIPAQSIRPDLLLPAGVATQVQPPDCAEADAVAGAAEVARLGQADAGQGCLVRGAQIIASEGADGTDAMLRASDARDAVLYKAPKPLQDRRADLPAIGPNTAREAKGAGVAGVIIEAGGVLVIDAAETIAAFDADGLFLWARSAEVLS